MQTFPKAHFPFNLKGLADYNHNPHNIETMMPSLLGEYR
jgi:hypothetical protein